MSDQEVTNRVRCVLLGAGGHAKVLLDCLEDRPDVVVIAALDTDTTKYGGEVLGVPVIGGDGLIWELAAGDVTHFLVGVGSTRDNEPRRALFQRAVQAGLHPISVFHPSAIVSRHAALGPGCQILAGAIINAGAVLGTGVIINSGAIVEHDCAVGDHVHIATGARLASSVIVETLAFVGAGATVRQCLTIGESAVVGAGAVVVADVQRSAVVVGSPARERGSSRA